MLNGDNLNMKWHVVVAERAKKHLSRIPKEYIKRIKYVIDKMELDPWSGDIERLKGEGYLWRRRIGSYRILFEILTDQRIVFIYEIKRRSSSTY